MSAVINRKIWAGVSSERPATGKPGDIWVMLSDSVGPELQVWDDYTRDWAEWHADELELLDGVVAGTSKAGRVVVLDANSQIDTLHRASYKFGTITHKYEDKTISSAQLLALNAAPIALTAVPGAANYIVFEGAILWLDYVSAAYAAIAAGDDIAIQYGAAGTVVATCEATGFLDQTADEVRWVEPGGAANTVDLSVDGTNELNVALYVKMLNTEVTTGDSPLKIRTFYAIVPKAIA